MANLQRVRQVSRLLAWLCWIPIAFMIAMFLLFVAGIEPVEYVTENTHSDTIEDDGSTTTSTTTSRYKFGYGERFDSGIDLSFLPRLAYAICTAIPAAALLFGLLKLRELFKTYATGEIFSEAAAKCMKWFAFGLIGSTLLQPISDFCRYQVLMLASTGDMSIHFDYQIDGLVIFPGLVFLVIAWVLGEAARIAEDNRSIV